MYFGGNKHACDSLCIFSILHNALKNDNKYTFRAVHAEITEEDEEEEACNARPSYGKKRAMLVHPTVRSV